MREERRREQTKLLNKLRGIEEEPEEKEEIIEEELEEENKKSHKTLLLSIFIIILIVVYATTIEPKYLFKELYVESWNKNCPVPFPSTVDIIKHVISGKSFELILFNKN